MSSPDRQYYGRFAALGCAFALACSSPEHAASSTDEDANPLVLHARSRRATSAGEVEIVDKTLSWAPAETAIIVVDMWDDHWCEGAAARVAELAGPLDAMLETARERGVFILHAPSSVVDFYDGASQRERAREASVAAPPVPLSTAERWGTGWCWPDDGREPGMPIDDSDMGCDCAVECELREAWTRQIETLTIDERDAITDDGQEAFNLLAERGIENVMLAGVHLNMCVLGRPVGIRQMTYLGKNVVLVRDMTDTMYDSGMRPFVDHFSGTDLVIEHVEEHWCPSVLSSDLTGAPPFRFAEDRRE